MTDLVQAQDSLASVTRAVSAISTSTLDFKIQWLRQHRSTDPIQQMQSEAIIELHGVVKQLQRALATTPPLPGAEAAAAARAAAARAAAARAAAASAPGATLASDPRSLLRSAGTFSPFRRP